MKESVTILKAALILDEITILMGNITEACNYLKYSTSLATGSRDNIDGITRSLKKAESLCRRLAQGTVTPISLYDVVVDLTGRWVHD